MARQAPFFYKSKNSDAVILAKSITRAIVAVVGHRGWPLVLIRLLSLKDDASSPHAVARADGVISNRAAILSMAPQICSAVILYLFDFFRSDTIMGIHTYSTPRSAHTK